MQCRKIHPIDVSVVDCIERAGVDLVCSLPCNMLAGVLVELEQRNIHHIRVCREEEGVGIAAGAALVGCRPLLLMQNSGLGNSINALASLTSLYRLPLFLLMSHRGGVTEKIAAQIPMGRAAPELLRVLDISFIEVKSAADTSRLEREMLSAYRSSSIRAAFLSGELWQ